MRWLTLLVITCLCAACGNRQGTGTTPQIETNPKKWTTIEKPIDSLDALKSPETRKIAAAATQKDVAAGVPVSDLVTIRLTMARGDDGNLYGKGFGLNIVVSDHVAFLSALSPAQRAEYRSFLAKAGATTDAQITAFTPHARVLLSHAEGDTSADTFKLSDAQLVSDGGAAAGPIKVDGLQTSVTQLSALSQELQVAVRAAYGSKLVDPSVLPEPVFVRVNIARAGDGQTNASASAELNVMDHRAFLAYLAPTPASAKMYRDALSSAGATLNADGNPDAAFSGKLRVTVAFDDQKKPLLLSAGAK